MPEAVLALLSAALLLSGCAREDLGNDTPEVAIRFSPYVPLSYTRAGGTGVQKLATLKSGDGFGVFAYYTDNTTYTAGSYAPNFMYNERVHWLDAVPGTGTDATMPYPGTVSDMAEARWVYSPIKFWPNEHGASAGSSDVDRISFFAYAPYIEADPATGQPAAAYSTKNALGEEVGITRLVAATEKADPYIDYNTGSGVDLMWAVVPKDPSTETSEGSGIWIVDDSEAIENGPTLTAGLPWRDMTKQKVNGTVRLHFLHALAGVQIGKVRAVFNETENPNTDFTTLEALNNDGYPLANRRATDTRILVEKVTLTTPAGKAYGSGRLNLNNTTPFVPRWVVGELDRLTADENHDITAVNPWLKDPGDAYFTAAHDLTSEEMLETEHPVGVVHQNLPLTDGSTAPFLLLNPDDQLDGNEDGLQTVTVGITYSVNTYDDQLSGHWERHTQTCTREVVVSNKPGTLTTVHVLIGMTSVKFEAEVSEWGEGAQHTIYLPENITE